MADTLPTEILLNIVTPDKLVAQDSVSAVTLPGKSGYLGILPGHAPLLTEMSAGDLVYTRGGSEHHVAICWGFAEVLPNRVIVLADSAERAEEIDISRAEKAKERAEERLKRFSDPHVDQQKAREALRRAIARLESARHAVK
jgi:F-type H+-transporting ATPase subunit epsilon